MHSYCLHIVRNRILYLKCFSCTSAMYTSQNKFQRSLIVILPISNLSDLKYLTYNYSPKHLSLGKFITFQFPACIYRVTSHK